MFMFLFCNCFNVYLCFVCICFLFCFCCFTERPGTNRHMFLRGQSFFLIFFPGVKCFFPVANSHFGTPKTNFRRFKSEKKKKKKSPHLFFLITFPTSISNFPPSLLQFSFFSSQFFAPFQFFSLPFFSRYVRKNFPVRSLWGALCPLPPTYTPLRASCTE